jgi:hypothetical protein
MTWTQSGFRTWCEAADRLNLGGQINSSDAEIDVLDKRPSSEGESIVIVEFRGRKYSATVRNFGIGQNAFFQPA